MTARVVQVSGERLSDFLRQTSEAPKRVDVTPAPGSWVPLKPALTRFARQVRERGSEPPTFSGVPLCLFGSEWSGFRSTPRTVAARGRCIGCLARDACGFPAEVPDELLPISSAPALQRWRDYGAAFEQVTGSHMATASIPLIEKIVAAYRGPVSIEPSVLIADGVDPSLRVVVFPHHAGAGTAAAAQYSESLACVDILLAEIGSNRCAALLDALGSLPPSPLPIGLDGRGDSWRLKLYLRVEDKTAAEKQALLDALSRFAPSMHPVPTAELQMVGLVLDGTGLHTVKAYVAAGPTGPVAAGFPPPLAADHPLVSLAGDQALATLDVWCRGERRANKWDFNLRDHYLAGQAAERLVAELASPRSAAELRPLLVGPTYRTDVVAVGVRKRTVALYMELN